MEAVSRTDVLLLPQSEPWDAIAPPLRRLLFRYWCGSADSRVRAHQDAREFLEAYVHDLAGAERAEAVIECLWHEAEVLRLSQNPSTTELLTTLAERLSPGLAGPVGPDGVMVSRFRDREVRKFADRQMREDEELMRAIGDRALFETIRAIMVQPDGGNMS